MDSKIKNLINLQNHAVAVLQAAELPEKVLQFKAGSWGCVIAMLVAASKGKVAAFSDETTTCVGGRAGLGFCYVGLTDPSARKFIDKNLLSFAMSYEKFLQLENCAEESFLKYDAWEKILKRI